MNHILILIQFILATEQEDYSAFCEENEIDPDDFSGEVNKKHIYATAMLANDYLKRR